MKGKIIDKDTSNQFDGNAVSKKYTSITPITFKFTDTSYFNTLVDLHEN
jgi:broad specificity polyphosphatase/5'/3'-nucleotidase SurE